MKSVLSEFIKSFPTNRVTIERFSEVTNSIWEKERVWTPIYSDVECLFMLRNQQGSENELAQKEFVKAKFECRVELVDIWQTLWDTAITNVTSKDRCIIWGKVYKIEFPYWALWDNYLIDHLVLYLNLID